MECIGMLEMQNRRGHILKFARYLVRHSKISAINNKAINILNYISRLHIRSFKPYLVNVIDKKTSIKINISADRQIKYLL